VNFSVTAFPGRTFTGSVAAVEPAGATTSNVVTYVVRIAVDPTDVQLLPSMTATVTIVTQSADNAIEVPNAAITWAQSQAATQPASQPGSQRGGQPAAGQRSANGASVFVLRNGAPVRVPIQTGITDGVNTQVLAGIQPGEQVITGTSTGSSSRTATSGSGNIFGFGGPGGGGGNNNRPAGQGGQGGQGAPGGQGGQQPGG
jgi:HlyD family secretion protein